MYVYSVHLKLLWRWRWGMKLSCLLALLCSLICFGWCWVEKGVCSSNINILHTKSMTTSRGGKVAEWLSVWHYLSFIECGTSSPHVIHCHPLVLVGWWGQSKWLFIIINPLIARVVGAPQMILQPVFSIFPCSPLSSGTYRTLGLSIPWCCLPTSSFVRIVFFPLVDWA